MFFFANEIAILKSHDFYHPSHFEHIAGLLWVEVIYPIASWIRIDLRISIITALWVCFHLFYRNMLRKCFRNQGNPDLVWWSIDQLVWWEVSSQKLPTIFFTFWLRGTWNVIIVWKYLGNEAIYRRRSQELTCCLLDTKHTHTHTHKNNHTTGVPVTNVDMTLRGPMPPQTTVKGDNANSFPRW